MPAGQQRTITAEDLYEFRTISNVRISPDGEHVIYAEQRVDRKTEKKFTNLWVASTDGSEARQFTFGDQVDKLPRWSPDGAQIAFLSNRENPEKPARLYLIPFSGGEARPLTEIQGNLNDFTWSPDGKQIACSVIKLDAEEIERQQDEQKKKLGVVARHYTRLFYKYDGVGYLPRERTHLWLVDVASGEARQLTDHPVFDEISPAWSPDGKTIACVSNRSDDPDQHPDREEICLVNANTGELNVLELPIGPKSLPSFSPDGKWVAFFMKPGEGDWYKNTHLWLAAVDGSVPARDLLEGLDLHVEAATINDIGAAEQMPPTWSVDGERIYFQVVLHGSTLLMAVEVSSGDLTTILPEGGVVVDFSLDRKQETLAYTYGRMDDPCQIFARDLHTGQTNQLTSLNSFLKEIDLGEIEEVWFNGLEGNSLQGWILKPPNFDPGRQYPSIMEIHGGPLTQYGNFFMHEFYYLAAGGYVVYFSNPRGGRGYGEEHAGAIWGGWGGADYADLMAWADYLATKPYIDPQRMGVTGGSYGGYMTVWIIGHTDRFKAAVTQRCVSNFISMWGSSDRNWVFQQIMGDEAPFQNLEKFWKHSPIAYIGSAKTPTLVIHSENDMRCPIEQGEQVFVALKRLGVDTEFVRFPEEFHGLSRGGRTDRRIVRLSHIRGWFDRYLQ
jgi:dipeptidyl aminopeptidase/acylaminoacyl peptidase